MARFDTYVTVPSDVFALLGAAAAEVGVTLNKFASQACNAAGRIWLLNPYTTTMPSAGVPVIIDRRSEVLVSISDPALKAIADAAVQRGTSIQSQIRGILIAAVEGYELPPPVPAPVQAEASKIIQRVEAAKPKPVAAIPKRQPFDPSYYARKAIIRDDARPATSAELTAAAFGDPRR